MDLPPIDHHRRMRTLTEVVAASDVDAVLMTDLVDVRWASGFTGSNGWLVVSAGGATLGTDGRYLDRARAETAEAGVEVVAEQLPARLRERLIERCAGHVSVGLDPASASHARWTDLEHDVALTPLTSPVRALRRSKDDAEVARIEAAAGATDAALAEVEPLLTGTGHGPVTERELRSELEYRMRLHGADDRSYDTIVAAGPEHAARPHHEASDRVIREGDMVIIDVGGLVDGYHSDMTRSWVIGEPTELQCELHELTVAAQSAGLDTIAAGVAARDVDAACRDLFAEAGYGEWFVHGTGHGVGLQIHEPPFSSRVSDETLVVGDVVTVEPGLYREGVGGVRIEDLVVVTEAGHRTLTHSPRRDLRTH